LYFVTEKLSVSLCVFVRRFGRVVSRQPYDVGVWSQAW
jgi:hypothetical protein